MTIVLSTLAIVSPWLPLRMSCSSCVSVILWGLSGSCSFRPASEPVPVRWSAMGLPSESMPNWSQCTKSCAPGSSRFGFATLKPLGLPFDDCGAGRGSWSNCFFCILSSAARSSRRERDHRNRLDELSALHDLPPLPVRAICLLLPGHRWGGRALQVFAATVVPDDGSHKAPATVDGEELGRHCRMSHCRQSVPATKYAASSGSTESSESAIDL